MATPHRSGRGHMSVRDRCEEIILIHVLMSERLLVLCCGLPSNPLKVLLFARWETIESFSLTFMHNRQMCFSQEPDHRPPQITGRIVSTVSQGGSEALPNSSRSEFTTLSLISPRKVCGHEIPPRPIQDLLETFSSRCWPRSPREIIFPYTLKICFRKICTKMGP